MNKDNYKIIILVILIIIATSIDILLLLSRKDNDKEKKINYKLCLKEEDIGTTEEEVNIDGKILKNVLIFKYHVNRKIEINYDEENDTYNIIENEIETFKDRSYYEANKKFYDANETKYSVLDDENMILSFSTQYEKKSDEMSNFISILIEDDWICQ